MKLYPPQLEGTLPSFYIAQEKETVLTIPFSMNRAVSPSEVFGYSLIVKDVINGNEILTKSTSNHSSTEEAFFNLNVVDCYKFTIGAYYKIQLAYIDKDGNEGYYSTVGVIKCTSQPTVNIEGLVLKNNNAHKYTYTGYYNNVEDPTEKVYTYQFILTDKNGDIVSDSGRQIHQNVDNATNSFESTDTYSFPFDLEAEEGFLLQYIITTNNNLVVKSPKYRIVQMSMNEMQENIRLEASLNFDEGYINLKGVYDEDDDIIYQLDTSNTYLDFITYYKKNYIQVDIGKEDYRPNYFYYLYNSEYRLSTSVVFNNAYTYYESYYTPEKVLPDTYKTNTYYIKQEHFIKGNFLLSRSCQDTNYKEWQNLATIKIEGYGKEFFNYQDYTIEQGKYYKYCLQQYNNYGTLSKRKITNVIFSDFEDMFLFDGERQLKIKYNPKVSSFKADKLMSKTDTIGGKYPYIFQNNITYYHEFPLAGLISYKMDEAENFMSAEELGLSIEYDKLQRTSTYEIDALKEQILENVYKINENNENLEIEYKYYSNGTKNRTIRQLEADNKRLQKENSELQKVLDKRAKNERILSRHNYKTTNLESLNIAAERIFKTEVLDWLNNGKPKLFRSPGEGNFIIMLMNVSFTPEDTLGRMLHSFSATAYEIADFNYQNLVNFNLLQKQEINYNFLLWKTINIAEAKSINNIEDEYILDDNFKEVNYYLGDVEYNYSNLLEDNTAYSLYFSGMAPGSIVLINGEEIVISATGNYYTESKEGFTSVIIPEGYSYIGSLTYNYYGMPETEFDLLTDEIVSSHAGVQFIGENKNILDKISNRVSSVKDFGYLQFLPRDIIEVSLAPEEEWDNKYYLDDTCEVEVIFVEQNKNTEEDTINEEIPLEEIDDSDVEEDSEINYGYRIAIEKLDSEFILFDPFTSQIPLTMKGYYKVINGSYQEIGFDEPYDENTAYYTLSYPEYDISSEDIQGLYKLIRGNYQLVSEGEEYNPGYNYYERFRLNEEDIPIIDEEEDLELLPFDEPEDTYLNVEQDIYYYQDPEASGVSFLSVNSINDLEEGIEYYKNNRYFINPFQIGNLEKKENNEYYCVYREGFYLFDNSKKINIWDNYYPLYRYTTNKFIYQNKIYSILDDNVSQAITVYRDVYSDKYYIDEETVNELSKDVVDNLITNYNFELLNFEVKFDENKVQIGPTIKHIRTGKKFNLYEIIDIEDEEEFNQIIMDTPLYVIRVTDKMPTLYKYTKEYTLTILSEETYKKETYYLYDENNQEYYLDNLDFYNPDIKYYKLTFLQYIPQNTFDENEEYYYYQDFSKFKFFTNANCDEDITLNVNLENCENYYIVDNIKSTINYSVNHAKAMKDIYTFKDLNIGNAVVLNCAYQTIDNTYALENFQNIDTKHRDGKLQYIKEQMNYYKDIYEQKESVEGIYNFQNIALTDLNSIVEFYKQDILEKILMISDTDETNLDSEMKKEIENYSNFLKTYNAYLSGQITTLTEFKDSLGDNGDLLKTVNSLIQEKLILKDYAKAQYLKYYNMYVERIEQLLTIYNEEA